MSCSPEAAELFCQTLTEYNSEAYHWSARRLHPEWMCAASLITAAQSRQSRTGSRHMISRDRDCIPYYLPVSIA